MSDILRDLDAEVDRLPKDAIRGGLESAFDAVAEYLHRLDRPNRAAALTAMLEWLADHESPWHSATAIEMAIRFHDVRLLEAATVEANRLGVHDLAPALGYPSWLVFHLDVQAAMRRWPSDLPPVARSYLDRLRQSATGASSYSRRLLAIRAWISLCLREEGGRDQCLRNAIKLLRSWSDRRLTSTLGTLYVAIGNTPHGYRWLKAVLTPDEWTIATRDMAFLPIRYRDFSDIPRLIAVEFDDEQYLLDCPFDADSDDYSDHFNVYRLPPSLEVPESGPWTGLIEQARLVGRVPVQDVRFDDTKRHFIDDRLFRYLLKRDAG